MNEIKMICSQMIGQVCDPINRFNSFLCSGS